MGLDIWLKRVWLLIGLLVLLTSLVVVVIFIVESISTGERGGPLVGPRAQPKGPDSLIVQDLSYDMPRRVGRTDLYFIGIHVKDLVSPTPSSALRVLNYSKDSYGENLVNIVFTKRDGSASYSLLDRRAYLKTTDIPTEADSLQLYSLYDISFADTDHDGRITAKDSSQLFISDLNGDRLAQISKGSDILISYEKSVDRKQIFLLFKQKIMKPEVRPQDWPERLYVFDVASRTMSPFPKDGQTFERVRKMLSNN